VQLNPSIYLETQKAFSRDRDAFKFILMTMRSKDKKEKKKSWPKKN